MLCMPISRVDALCSSDVVAGCDRNACIGFGKSGGIVDPVSDHDHLSSLPVFFFNKGRLVFRQYLHVKLVHPDPRCDGRRRAPAVSRHHHDLVKPGRVQPAYRKAYPHIRAAALGPCAPAV